MVYNDIKRLKKIHMVDKNLKERAFTKSNLFILPINFSLFFSIK